MTFEMSKERNSNQNAWSNNSHYYQINFILGQDKQSSFSSIIQAKQNLRDNIKFYKAKT